MSQQFGVVGQRKVTLLGLLGLLGTAVSFSGCADRRGACVGTGGALFSSICKSETPSGECSTLSARKDRGAMWVFHEQKSCTAIGFTERCEDGTFRLPGGC